MTYTGKIAAAQALLAARWGCDAALLRGAEHVFLPTNEVFLEVWTFGRGAILRGSPELLDWCRGAFAGLDAGHMMDGDGLFRLEGALRARGHAFTGEHVRYLHIGQERPARPLPPGIMLELREGEAVRALDQYKGFDNALNHRSDVIALTAFAGETPVAMAVADDNLGDLWQIGVDTALPWRGLGLATHLVQALTRGIEARGRLPFYTTWSANIASTRVALDAGYRPVWMGYIAEPIVPSDSR